MTRWLLPMALILFCVAHAAAQGARPVQVVNPRLAGPATFKTNECVVSIPVDSAGARPSGETTVLIDDRHRLTLRVLPRISPGPSFVTFIPHNSLCDGRTHKVELTWKGGQAAYQSSFPVLGTGRLPPVPTLPRK